MGRRVKISPSELEHKCASVAPITPGFDLLADSVVITDTDSNILYANKAAQEKTGYTLKEMLGKNPGDLWGGHMLKEIYEDMYRTIVEKKKSWHGQVKNRHKDGTEYWQWLRVNPILDSKDECIYYLAIEPDIDSSQLENVDDVNKSLMHRIALSDVMQDQQMKIEDLKKAVDELKSKLDNKK